LRPEYSTQHATDAAELIRQLLGKGGDDLFGRSVGVGNSIVARHGLTDGWSGLTEKLPGCLELVLWIEDDFTVISDRDATLGRHLTAGLDPGDVTSSQPDQCDHIAAVVKISL